MEINQLPNPTHIYETEIVFCCLLDGSIFYSHIKPGTSGKLKDIEIIFEQYKKHIKNGPLKSLFEMGEHASMDLPSRKYLEKHKVKVICEAIVISNLGQRMIANFYIAMKSSEHPSKAFKSRVRAMEWINSF